MALTRLKQLREEAVLTVHELAEASGVSDDTISKIENGQRVARPNTLRKLASALGVSPQELRRPAKTEELAGAGKAEAPSPGPSLGELLERAGTPTRWLAIPQDKWFAALEGLGKADAADRLLRVALDQIEESSAVTPFLFRGEVQGRPALTPQSVEAWRSLTQRKLRTISALEALLADPEVPEEQKHTAEMLMGVYKGIGKSLERLGNVEDGAEERLHQRVQRD